MICGMYALFKRVAIASDPSMEPANSLNFEGVLVRDRQIDQVPQATTSRPATIDEVPHGPRTNKNPSKQSSRARGLGAQGGHEPHADLLVDGQRAARHVEALLEQREGGQRQARRLHAHAAPARHDGRACAHGGGAARGGRQGGDDGRRAVPAKEPAHRLRGVGEGSLALVLSRGRDTLKIT